MDPEAELELDDFYILEGDEMRRLADWCAEGEDKLEILRRQSIIRMLVNDMGPSEAYH